MSCPVCGYPKDEDHPEQIVGTRRNVTTKAVAKAVMKLMEYLAAEHKRHCCCTVCLELKFLQERMDEDALNEASMLLPPAPDSVTYPFPTKGNP
jgi:hypothetical protein